MRTRAKTKLTRRITNVTFVISKEKLIILRKNDFAINNFKYKIRKLISTTHWNVKSTHKFRRHARKLNIISDLIFNGDSLRSPAVVSFPFMVEIIYKVHNQLVHIGRHKLLNALKNTFDILQWIKLLGTCVHLAIIVSCIKQTVSNSK